MSSGLAVTQKWPMPRQAVSQTDTATVGVEQNESLRIEESGSPNGMPPNCLEARRRGSYSETRNVGLYEADIIPYDLLDQVLWESC